MNDEIREAIMQFQTAIDFKEAPMPMNYSIDLENAKILLDYITNLQNENQEMKTNTIPTLKHNIDALVDEVDELEDYKSRVEKAVEYNGKIIKVLLTCSSYEKDKIEDMLYKQQNILQNGSDSK